MAQQSKRSHRHEEILGIKIILLLVATALFGSSLVDLLAATSPTVCQAAGGGSCIYYTPTAVLIQGVGFVGTLRSAVLGGFVTVAALFLDVAEHFWKE